MGSEDADAHARGLCGSGRQERRPENAAVSPLTFLETPVEASRQKVVPT
jgi:hypothetical protein